MAIKEVSGNLFQHPWQSAVITVNLMGVMGAGIAKAARDINYNMFTWYRDLCQSKQFNLGDIHYYTQHDGKTFILLPTKIDWKNPSTLEYIEISLQALVNTYRYHHVEHIHTPKLGCKNGQLDWKDVRPLMYDYLSDLAVDVTIVI